MRRPVNKALAFHKLILPIMFGPQTETTLSLCRSHGGMSTAEPVGSLRRFSLFCHSVLVLTSGHGGKRRSTPLATKLSNSMIEIIHYKEAISKLLKIVKAPSSSIC